MSWLAALQADAVGWLIVPEYGFRFESYLSSRLIVTHSRRGLLSLSSGLSMLRIDFVAAEPGDCPRASRFLQHVLKISPLPTEERTDISQNTFLERIARRLVLVDNLRGEFAGDVDHPLIDVVVGQN